MDPIKYLLITLLLTGIIACNNTKDSYTISESGTAEAINSIISSQSTGKVKKIYFFEGEQVKKGDTLLEIDHELLDIQLIQAKAGYSAAEAAHKLLLLGARDEDKLLAKEKLNEAEAALELAKSNYNRVKKLFEAKAVTKTQFEEVSTQLDINKARFKSAEENLKKVENYTRPEELKQTEAHLNNKLANIDIIKRKIDDCYIISPIDGYIVSKYIELGEVAIPMSVLFKISDLSQIEISIYISETKLGKIKLGQHTKVTIDSFPDRVFEGYVTYISPRAEFTPKTIQTKEERTKLVYKVKIKVNNDELIFKEGMPVDVVIEVE